MPSPPHPPHCSRRATELADVALGHPAGSAVVFEPTRGPVVLAATAHRYGALVGVRCPPGVEAVAAAHEAILTVDGRRRAVTIAVAVTRAGGDAARFREPGTVARSLHDLDGPLVDIGRLALGLATPRCARTPLDLLDAAFTESVMRLLLGADLGWRPSWADLCAHHPLADSLPVGPEELRRRRWELDPVDWSQVRRRIIAQRCRPDPELTPSLARWLDEGSLARWLFARYPEPDQMFADVCELLDPSTAAAFRAAHVSRPA